MLVWIPISQVSTFYFLSNSFYISCFFICLFNFFSLSLCLLTYLLTSFKHDFITFLSTSTFIWLKNINCIKSTLYPYFYSKDIYLILVLYLLIKYFIIVFCKSESVSRSFGSIAILISMAPCSCHSCDSSS